MNEVEESSGMFRRDGYLILKNRVSPEKVKALFQICESIYDQWKRESYEGGEPGGHHYQPAAWSILHVNNPRYYRMHPEWLPIILDAIGDADVVALLDAIFEAKSTFLQANYYIDPPTQEMLGGWHRDCQFFTPGDEEAEKAMLIAESDPPRELHMHIPLVPTQATAVVPGSHLRWDTPGEYHIRRGDPLSVDIPGGKWLQLEPGDLAFFHVNALHRGRYTVGVPRRTIAITYGSQLQPRLATVEYMRNFVGYCATYQPWLLGPHYLDGVKPFTRQFFHGFIDTYRDTWKPEYLIPEIGEGRIAYYNESCAVDLSPKPGMSG